MKLTKKNTQNYFNVVFLEKSKLAGFLEVRETSMDNKYFTLHRNPTTKVLGSVGVNHNLANKMTATL